MQGKPRTTATTEKERKTNDKERKKQTKVNTLGAYTTNRYVGNMMSLASKKEQDRSLGGHPI
jgi:hypothetical protein